MLLFFSFIVFSCQTVLAKNSLITSVRATPTSIVVNYKGGEVRTKYFLLDSDKKGEAKQVFDLLDTELTTKQYIGKLTSKNSSVKVNQFSVTPLVTRVVVSGPVAQVKNFNILNADGKLTISFSSPQKEVSQKQISKNVKETKKKTYISDVEWKNNSLIVSTDGEAEINKFFDSSSGTNRKIYDLNSTALSSMQLARSLSPKFNGTSESVKLVQFSPSKVRLMVEGPEASSWELHPDQSGKVLVLSKKKQETQQAIETAQEEKQQPQKQIVQELSSDKQNTSSGNVSLDGDSPVTIKIKYQGEKPKLKYFQLHSPDRLVIDLYDWDTNGVPKQTGSTLLLGVRQGYPDKDKKTTRLVFDLSADHYGVNLVESSVDNEIHLRVTEHESSQDKKSIASLRANIRKDAKIMIDAGHGGYDAGAIYGGVQEKSLTLQMAKQIELALEKQNYKVVQTREEDVFVGLEERVNMTRNSKPDLFISVHCNALESSSQISGIETYYFTPQSLELAQIIHKKLVKSTGLNDRNVRKARFVVIRETSIPSILVETGYLSNPGERDKLSDPDHQKKVADAIVKGVNEYINNLSEEVDDKRALMKLPN